MIGRVVFVLLGVAGIVGTLWLIIRGEDGSRIAFDFGRGFIAAWLLAGFAALIAIGAIGL